MSDCQARYRAVLAYDGTNYHGFQRLSGEQPTIQGKLEAALENLSGGPVKVTGAGRTDAGVHATGQVIAFDLDWRHGEDDLLRAVNANLPNDIALQRLERTRPDFHPRYDALSRTYRYWVHPAPIRQPTLERLAWWVRGEPDIDKMNAASAVLIGSHDFASFGTPPRGEKGTTQRRVLGAAWTREALPDGVSLCAYRIEADAFLYRMVRTTVAALIEVGLGRMTIDQFVEIFQARDRARIGLLAPAHGLTLVAVKYNDHGGETPAGAY